MTRKGLRTLDALLPEFKHLIDAVVVSSDENLQDDCREDISKLCISHGLDCYDRSDGIPISTEYALAISWRWIIPDMEGRLIVIHDSILPKYRGFNPLVSALINGDPEIGATALWATNKYDQGPIITQAKTQIEYPMKIAKAIDIVAESYAVIAKKIASSLAMGQIDRGSAQDEGAATYSLWRDEADYRIDWTTSAARILRQIHAQGFPYSGATSMLGGQQIKVIDGVCVEDVEIVNRDVGKVIFVEDGCPTVVCGEGLLKITEAVFFPSNKSVLPMRKFRVRFH